LFIAYSLIYLFAYLLIYLFTYLFIYCHWNCFLRPFERVTVSRLLFFPSIGIICGSWRCRRRFGGTHCVWLSSSRPYMTFVSNWTRRMDDAVVLSEKRQLSTEVVLRALLRFPPQSQGPHESRIHNFPGLLPLMAQARHHPPHPTLFKPHERTYKHELIHHTESEEGGRICLRNPAISLAFTQCDNPRSKATSVVTTKTKNPHQILLQIVVRVKKKVSLSTLQD
jgi:hypothetical protein